MMTLDAATRDSNLDLLWSPHPLVFGAACRALGADEYDHGAVLTALSATVVRAPLRRFPCAALAMDMGAGLGGHSASYDALLADVASVVAMGYPAAAAVLALDEEGI